MIFNMTKVWRNAPRISSRTGIIFENAPRSTPRLEKIPSEIFFIGISIIIQHVWITYNEIFRFE